MNMSTKLDRGVVSHADAFSIATLLYARLRRVSGRVIDVMYLVENPSYARQMAELALSTEDAERLFERGYRGSSVGNVTGGGIGLSIVRRLCELYGWNVSIAPREQGGAVAILQFS